MSSQLSAICLPSFRQKAQKMNKKYGSHICSVNPPKIDFLMKNGHHFVKNLNFGKKNETLLGKGYLHILTKFQLNRTFLASPVKKTYTKGVQKNQSIRMDYSTLTFNISETKIVHPMIFLSDVPPTVCYMPTTFQAESSKNE